MKASEEPFLIMLPFKTTETMVGTIKQNIGCVAHNTGVFLDAPVNKVVCYYCRRHTCRGFRGLECLHDVKQKLLLGEPMEKGVEGNEFKSFELYPIDRRKAKQSK